MKQLLIAATGLMVVLASSCGGTIDDQEGIDLGQSQQAVCPGSGYSYVGTCYDWGAGPYYGVCGSTTYSYWKCQQYQKVINGVTYRYRAYCGPQQEGCSRPGPRCQQNC